MPTIVYDDFAKVEMRVGKITRVEEFPKARRPAYKLWIDFGPDIGLKKSSAQITKYYRKEDLLGRLIIAVVNFPPRQVADFMSEVLILGAIDEQDEVILLQPERDATPGLKVA
jgi:tRNA-binding protein